MKYVLSRKQRAASASFGMMVVTAFSLMLFHYGYRVASCTNEVCTALIYTIWVKLGTSDEAVI